MNPDERLDLTPPSAPVEEVRVLGSCLLDPIAIDLIMAIVKPDDFESEANHRIYQAITFLHRQNRPVDLVSVSGLLKDHGRLDEVGGLEYLSGILEEVPTGAWAESSARIVRDRAQMRDAIKVLRSSLAQAHGNYGDADSWLGTVTHSLEAIASKHDRSKIRPIADTLSPALHELHEQAEAAGDVTGIPTGLVDLDGYTSGLQPGDLVIIAGRPSMGKTALAINIAANATSKGYPGIVFSIEMTSNQLNRRLLADAANVSAHRLRFPKRLEAADWTALTDACGHLSKLELLVDDSPEITVFEIRARSKRFAAKAGIRFIVVDYLQIVREIHERGQQVNRDRGLAEITRSLKALAKDLQVPVILLSQLNRGPENRTDKRPQLSDLRESGAIEQDADLILMLYREAAYKHNGTEEAEVLIRKNRTGPIGTVKLRFVAEFTRFETPALGWQEKAEGERKYWEKDYEPHPAEPPEKDEGDEQMPF